MDGLAEEKKSTRPPKDPRYLLAYKIPDLERILPWNRKTIHEMIDSGVFPAGRAMTPGAHPIWTKRAVDAYLEIVGAEAMAQLPEIAATVRNLKRSNAA